MQWGIRRGTHNSSLPAGSRHSLSGFSDMWRSDTQTNPNHHRGRSPQRSRWKNSCRGQGWVESQKSCPLPSFRYNTTLRTRQQDINVTIAINITGRAYAEKRGVKSSLHWHRRTQVDWFAAKVWWVIQGWCQSGECPSHHRPSASNTAAACRDAILEPQRTVPWDLNRRKVLISDQPCESTDGGSSGALKSVTSNPKKRIR